MPDGRTADARLERLLHVLPAAAREEGVAIAELAASLDTTPRQILDDLREVTERIYYHPGGWPDDVRIAVDGERLRVIHAHGLDRPVRLNARELLCLAVALRGGTSAAWLPDDAARQALLERAEAGLATGSGKASAGPAGNAPEADAPEPAARVHVADRVPDPEDIRETLLAAARARTPVGLMYAKAGADDADLRVVHPYVVAYADGHWYAVGHCTVSEGIRIFRTDRILEAAPADGTFQVPDAFDPADYLGGGRVYHARDDEVVRVRYSAKIARWVRERAAFRGAQVEEAEDGSVVLQHRVADPGWVVGHALQYGADAEILEPPEMRARVREVVEGLGG